MGRVKANIDIYGWYVLCRGVSGVRVCNNQHKNVTVDVSSVLYRRTFLASIRIHILTVCDRHVSISTHTNTFYIYGLTSIYTEQIYNNNNSFMPKTIRSHKLISRSQLY